MNTDETLNAVLVLIFQNLIEIERKCLITEEFSDMTMNDMHIVEAIGRENAKRSSDVAKLMSVTTGTLTRAVDGLVEHGYVERTRGEKDKRVVFLTLTERGIRAYERHKQFHAEMIANAKATLSEEELAILIRALKQLNDYFRNAYS